MGAECAAAGEVGRRGAHRQSPARRKQSRARRQRPRVAVLLLSAGVFGLGLGLAAIAPTFLLFALPLVAVGVAAQSFTTTANSVVQLSTDPVMRGRVIAILLAVAMGTTPIGAPFVGWVVDTFGPRWALGVGAASGFAFLGIPPRILLETPVQSFMVRP